MLHGREGGKLTFVSTRTAHAICSIPSRDRVSISKGAAAHGLNTALPTEEGTQALGGAPAMHPDAGATSVGSRTEQDGEEAKNTAGPVYLLIIAAMQTERKEGPSPLLEV